MKHEEMMCLYVYSNERRAVASDRCLAQGWFRDERATKTGMMTGHRE